MSRESEEFEFGYDATIIDFGQVKSIINYNHFEDKIEIPSDDLFRFMREWSDYLTEWKERQKKIEE